MASKPKKAKVAGQVTETEFLVEKILDKKCEEGVWNYHIKWIGWPSDANTWEPLTHLKGCEQMLTAFEKKWALENPGLAATTKPDNHNATDADESDYDSDEDVQESRDKARKYMDFDVMEECPPNKEPNRLVGVTDLNGTLTYLVEWKKDQENVTEDDEDDRSLIRSTVFQLKYPAIVIHFYENHISFAPKPTDNEVVAELASQAMTAARDRKVAEEGEAAPEPELVVDDATESTMNLDDLDTSSDSTQSGDAYDIDEGV